MTPMWGALVTLAFPASFFRQKGRFNDFKDVGPWCGVHLRADAAFFAAGSDDKD
jgi:hypothetical protein